MATPLRKQRLSLTEQLFDKPYEFEFPQAVKLLETLYAHKMPVGFGPDATLDAVRIHSNILLSTPPSDIYSLTRPEYEAAPARLTINFMGIAGQTGPLPNVYSELILDRIKAKDYAFRDFLDLFNNRLNGIHYRIHVKHNLALTQNLPFKTQVAEILNHFTGLMAGLQTGPKGALQGITQTHLHKSHHGKTSPPPLIPLRSYLKYAGLFWQKPRSASGLVVLLRDYFQLPFRVEQFQGQWTPIEHSQCTLIGKKGVWNTLGETASLGEKAWIQGEKILLKLNNLTLQDYTDLLPKGSLNKRISHVTRQYLGWENYFHYEIGLRSGTAISTRLNGTGALGWTSWMTNDPSTFSPESIQIPADDPLKG